MSADVRKFLASAAMLLLVVALMAVLFFIEVPKENRDVILTILSLLLGAATSAIPNLFGDGDAEKKALQARVAELEHSLHELQTQYREVKESYDKIVDMLIQRHVVVAEGITLEHKDGLHAPV